MASARPPATHCTQDRLTRQLSRKPASPIPAPPDGPSEALRDVARKKLASALESNAALVSCVQCHGWFDEAARSAEEAVAAVAKDTHEYRSRLGELISEVRAWGKRGETAGQVPAALRGAAVGRSKGGEGGEEADAKRESAKERGRERGTARERERDGEREKKRKKEGGDEGREERTVRGEGTEEASSGGRDVREGAGAEMGRSGGDEGSKRMEDAALAGAWEAVKRSVRQGDSHEAAAGLRAMRDMAVRRDALAESGLGRAVKALSKGRLEGRAVPVLEEVMAEARGVMEAWMRQMMGEGPGVDVSTSTHAAWGRHHQPLEPNCSSRRL